MEWAFAGAAQVQKDVTDIILNALSELHPSKSYKDIRGEIVPVLSEIPKEPVSDDKPAHVFSKMTFAESIAAYGSDKPDLRIPLRVRVDMIESFTIAV